MFVALARPTTSSSSPSAFSGAARQAYDLRVASVSPGDLRGRGSLPPPRRQNSKSARARESRVTVTSISLGANASASVGARVFCPWASSFARPIGHICRNKGNQWPLTPPRVSCSADEGERYFGLFASPPHTHAIAFVTVGIPCLADDGGIQSVSLACRFQSVTL